MTLYETTFILDSQMKDDGWEESIAKYSGIITRNGTIKETYRWGLRRMAYEIAKQSHGYYVHIIHESAPTVPRELERQFMLDENCLRHLTVLADNPLYIEEMDKQRVRQAESEAESASAATPAVASGTSVAPAAPVETAPAVAAVEADVPVETAKEDDKETE